MCQPGRPGPMARLPEKFARLGSFPEREIARVVFFVAIDIHARAGLHAGDVDFGKLSVVAEISRCGSRWSRRWRR